MVIHSHDHQHGDEVSEITPAYPQYTEDQLASLIQPPAKEFAESTESAENGPIDNLQDEKTPDIGEAGDDGDLFFEAAEHESVIYGVKLRNIHGIELPAADHECWTVKASDGLFGLFRPSKYVKLTFGRIIALGGDFYSTHNDNNRTPICGAFFAEGQDLNTPAGFQSAVERFRSAVRSIKDDSDRNLVQLNDLMNQESGGVDEAERRAGTREPHDHIHTISNAYHNHECGIPTNADWWKATVGLNNPKTGLYAWLAYINADHFGEDALMAYKVGHSEAMRLAREAGKRSSNHDRAAGLQDAYMHEAFALHYLTDMFSSGHIRTPRRELHNDDYTQQSKAAAALITGKNEVPIWDFQANYMHDNDSDVGLLVRNQLGHQWLCYGDKQFKESWDIVNRARIMHCVQASVDEIYEDAFLHNLEKHHTEFQAANLAPQPMLAAGQGPLVGWKSDWGGYDMHNVAPLWQVNSERNKNAWTVRAKINDHSVFDRIQSTPAPHSTATLGIPVANQECVNIQGSLFRTKGSAPTARPIEGLTTGGFLQIQDLSPGDDQLHTCVNFWGPVSVGIYDRKGNQEEHRTFTLRNRIVDFDLRQNQKFLTPLHSAKYHDKDGLLIYRLNLDQTGGKNQLSLSAWTVKERGASTPGLPAKFDASTSWAFESQKLFSDVQVSEISSNPSSSNLTRILVGHFSNADSPDVATIKFYEKGAPEVAIVGVDGLLRLSSTITPLDGIYNFTKKFKTEALDGILVASFNETESGSTSVSLNAITFSSQGTAVITRQASVRTVRAASKTVLVGDLSNTGRDEVVLLFESPNELVVSVTQFNSTGMQETMQRKVPQLYAHLPVIRPYFNALVSSEDPKSPNTMSILQVSLHSMDNSPHLMFRLTGTKSWTTETSNPIKDTLASDPNYFHIKWIRCSRDSSLECSTSNALLEVFSFYGVLGIRLFAPTDENRLADYEEIGRLQFMAQTSIGTGLGSEGDWGNGILTWGVKEHDFLDVVFWTPAHHAKAGEGSWGMTAGDINRPLVKGFEVQKRPGYSQ